MKKRIPFSVVTILVLVFAQIAITSSDLSSYDVMADVNRDRIVDAEDLARLGNAYGSSLVLPSEPAKTVVTVLSFDRVPPEVENARVAIIDPEMLCDAENVTYTDSSGIATFELSPSKNYTAIAWSGSAYNYANFTTDSFSEASVPISLGEPSLPPIRSLPQGWIVVTILDNETRLPYYDPNLMGYFRVDRLECTWPVGDIWSWENIFDTFISGGVYVLPINFSNLHEPCSARGITFWDSTTGRPVSSGVYSPNEHGCANVILYATP